MQDIWRPSSPLSCLILTYSPALSLSETLQGIPAEREGWGVPTPLATSHLQIQNRREGVLSVHLLAHGPGRLRHQA
jgi:hypothetical protein